MCKNKVKGRRWCDIERALQILLSDYKGLPVCKKKLNKAAKMVHKVAFHTAWKLCRRWYLPNAKEEASDAAMLWFEKLYDTCFDKYDAQFPLHRFAYRILRHCCTECVKRCARHRWTALEQEPDDGRADWLEDWMHTHDLELLSAAISQLPPQLRIAIEQSLAHQATGSRMTFKGERERRRFHNRTFQARQALKQLIADPPLQIQRSSQSILVA